MTWLKPRTAIQGSKLLMWRSQRASCCTSGISSSGDRGPARYRIEGDPRVPRILVVDDDAAVRELLRLVLEEEGYEVTEAANGMEGLQRYQADPTDLVITDLMMPGMDGLDLMQALQRETPPPVLMAMSGDQAALTQARALTPYTFVKPLSLEEILEAIRNLDLRR
jgi:CheY-like chemotaxis protein